MAGITSKCKINPVYFKTTHNTSNLALNSFLLLLLLGFRAILLLIQNRLCTNNRCLERVGRVSLLPPIWIYLLGQKQISMLAPNTREASLSTQSHHKQQRCTPAAETEHSYLLNCPINTQKIIPSQMWDYLTQFRTPTLSETKGQIGTVRVIPLNTQYSYSLQTYQQIQTGGPSVFP